MNKSILFNIEKIDLFLLLVFHFRLLFFILFIVDCKMPKNKSADSKETGHDSAEKFKQGILSG